MQILRGWNFTRNDINKIKENKFRYKYDLGTIDFIFLNKDEDKFFEMHDEIWCENKTEFFLAIFEKEEIHICDSKTRPDPENPIENATIDSFTYGENTPKARKYFDLFKKESIDTGECIKEIQRFLKDRKRITVDKDLIDNLESCKDRIIGLLRGRGDKEEIAQKIIDRCLFIRFLEDRAGRDTLKKVLRQGEIDGLLKLFDSYNDNLNGDVFKKEDIPRDINAEILKELDYIFGDLYTLSSLQRTLVPYSFKNIPTILISNIYEKFLSKKKKNSEGIVFTPENVVEYMINKIMKDKSITNKIEEGKIRILDPACGSGVFLVKFLEKIIKRKEKRKGKKLSLEEKANIVKNCLYGIDKTNDALRIAALSLYLKIIENEESEIINKRLFEKNKEHFMFPGLKKNKNLVEGNSLFDNLFSGENFDIIVGNPPWGYKFTEKEKKKIKDKWPEVSAYQSSQCFVLQSKEWMNEETVCGMVVNLSNFSNLYSKKFRKSFIKEKYCLKSFVNLSKIKNITFRMESEPACIVFFTNPIKDKTSNSIEFFSPDLSYFSELTGTISENNRSEILASKLVYNDNLWHAYALGYDTYLDLIEFLDENSVHCLNDFASKFEVGLMKYWMGSGLTRKEFYKRYKAFSKVNENYYPIIDSLKNIFPYFGKEAKEYLEYGSHLDRPRTIDLFIGKKLVTTRSWPIKTFIDSKDTLYDGNFFIFKLKYNYPKEYLSLLESILNSKLAKFYLGIKYLLREEGNYSKVNLEHLKRFPTPNLRSKKETIEKINRTVESLKSLESCNSSTYKKLQDHLDKLVFELYDLDYYVIQQIEHYHKMEKEKRRVLIKEVDMQEYCIEFIDTFKPFIKEEFFLNAEWGTSKFFGTMTKFTISKNKNLLLYNKKLEGFVHIIEKQEIGYDIKNIFKEEKIKFYDNDELYVYKSNKPKDWTKFMAIKDANEEIALFFWKMGGL